MAELAAYINIAKAIGDGGFWSSMGEDERARIRMLAERAAAQGWTREEFRAALQERPLYSRWLKTQQEPSPTDGGPPPEEPDPTDGEDPDVPPDPGDDIDDPLEDPGEEEMSEQEREDARALIRDFLASWGLSGLDAFVEQALSEGWGPGTSEFIIRLRETTQYQQAFPEMKLREQAGYSFIPEEQILAYRSEVRRLTRDYLGIELSQNELAQIIATDRSPAEWERTLLDWKRFERWGPTVKAVLESELGYAIPDDRAFAFLSLDIPTPELDLAYERALMRGQPAVLGFGIRPEEEADILQLYGIDATNAFRGYQGIAQELPRAERLALIDAEIARNGDRFPSGRDLFNEENFSTLFKAIQLGDPEALRRLQGSLAREVARFQGGGGPARQGTAAVGLLSARERQNL